MQVVTLWRAPVKSLQGEALPSAVLTGRGILGDRHWALRDEGSGRFLTARREPALLFGRATADDDRAVHLHLPDGATRTVHAGNDDERAVADAALSAWLGRPVRLVEASDDVAGVFENPLDAEGEQDWVTWQGPTGRFHDSTRTAVSLVTTGSLRGWDPRRFRANVVLAGGDGEEDALVGRTVRIGSAQLEITKQIDRCVMVTRPQPDGLARDLDVLRTVHRERRSCLAVAALVTADGHLAIGDGVEVVGAVDDADR
ncbi:MAG: MOSC N-terminal beta barrel domain-containing protein [Acidimicrobiales bacterium]